MLFNKTRMESASMVKPEPLTPQLVPKKYPAPTVVPSPSPEAPVAAGPICTGNAGINR